MERYDGKTKKDDYKKYALIAAGVVLLIVLYHVLTFVVHKVSHPTPDVVVVFGAATITDFQEEDDMEAEMKQSAADLDGNGKTVVDVVPYDIRENAAMSSSGLKDVGAEDGQGSFYGAIQNGEGLIFITHEASLLESCFTEEYLSALPEDMMEGDDPYRFNITGCAMLEAQSLGKVEFYAGIRKDATREEYDTAVAILRALEAS